MDRLSALRHLPKPTPGDIYKEGSAMAQGLRAEDSEVVSDRQRDDFKWAFIDTLHAYLYKVPQEDRDWLMKAIGVFTEGAAAGKTYDETLTALHDLAQAEGRVSRVEIH